MSLDGAARFDDSIKTYSAFLERFRSMYLKNLFRRKTRTFLTVFGIAIGVAAIIALGALAEGLEAGYRSILTGNKADLVLSQPDSFDVAYSSIEESVGDQLASAPEVKEISGMLQGFSQVENEPIFFIFGYPEESFLLERFEITSGEGLESRQTQRAQGRPILLGSAAAEVLDKKVGELLASHRKCLPGNRYLPDRRCF